MNFMAVKKLRKHSGFIIFKESVFTPVKTGYVKGESFVNRRYTEGIPLLSKMVYRKVRV